MNFPDFLVSYTCSLDADEVSLLENKQSQLLPRNCFSITPILDIVYEDPEYLLLYQGFTVSPASIQFLQPSILSSAAAADCFSPYYRYSCAEI